MTYLKCKYLIKIIAHLWIIFFLNFAHASESEELKLSSENYFAINEQKTLLEPIHSSHVWMLMKAFINAIEVM